MFEQSFDAEQIMAGTDRDKDEALWFLNIIVFHLELTQ
jgi:hypothetical protein